MSHFHRIILQMTNSLMNFESRLSHGENVKALTDTFETFTALINQLQIGGLRGVGVVKE